MHQPITLRPISAADMDLLYRIYASTRTEELAQVAWAEGQQEAFLQMQFGAQHQYYQANYPAARFLVIMHGAEPIGRLYLDRRPAEIRIVDIALLPEYRGQGIGSALLREILAEGERAAVPVSIHVERFNPALRLYERLGFRTVEDKGVYYLMAKAPGLAVDARGPQ